MNELIIPTFDQLMREHMNFYDMPTINMLAEATDNNQNQILIALTSKLYEMIVAKVAKIDYSSVANSRGDITKIENYSQLVETINIIKNIVTEYRCDVTPVATVEKAIENVQQRAGVFKRAFVIGAPVPVVLYNNICVDIVAAVSYMIDTCIEYIKNPQSESFQMALDVVAYNKTMESLMFDTLKTFNEGCKTGDIDEAINVSLTKSKVRREAAGFSNVVNEGVIDASKYLRILKFTHELVKIIRTCEEQGMSNTGIQQELKAKCMAQIGLTVGGGAVAFVATMGLAAPVYVWSIIEAERVFEILETIDLRTIKNMEKDYNIKISNPKKRRDFTSTYTEKDMKYIREVARRMMTSNEIQRVQHVKEDGELFAKEYREIMEDMCTVASDNPFMSDEDIDNPKMILHDGEESDGAPLGEGLDIVASTLGRGLLVLCKLVIPLIRHIVYLYFFSRQRISDYFESQAIAIEMNAYQLQYNQDMDSNRRQEIFNKQMKIAEKLRKKAMRTSIDYKKSQKDAEREIAKEQRKFTSSDLNVNMNDDTVDSAVAGSVLF